MIERVCVVGAGVIGGLIAGHLARVCAVTVLTRRSEQAQAINRDGLQISGKHIFQASVEATSEVDAIAPFDVAILATKATAVGEVARALGRHRPEGVVMCIQNGLGVEELVTSAGPWPIVSGVTFMSGTRHDDAHIEYELDTPTWVAPYADAPAPTESVQEIERLLLEAGLLAEAMADVTSAQWSKLIFNAGVSAVSALTELPHVELYAREARPDDLGLLVHGLIDEGCAAASAKGVALHEDPWRMNLRAVQHGVSGAGPYRHIPSMLEDVWARRRTEVDFINGALIREARAARVPVPLNEALYRLIKAKEASWQ